MFELYNLITKTIVMMMTISIEMTNDDDDDDDYDDEDEYTGDDNEIAATDAADGDEIRRRLGGGCIECG